MPNTWNVDISYSGAIGNNLIAESASKTGYDIIVNDPSTDVAATASEKPFVWIDFYTKPVNTRYGNMGFGYRFIEDHYKAAIFNGNKAVKLLDIPSGGGAFTSSTTGDKTVLSLNYSTTRYYATYSIPSSNSWYDGLGVRYAYEKSNFPRAISLTSAVVNPNRVSHILMVGIDLALDELDNGLNLKTLMIGKSNSKIDFYNYDSSQSQSFTVSDTQVNLGIIYLFKAKNHRQYHFSIDVLLRDEKETNYKYNEFKFDIGLRF